MDTIEPLQSTLQSVELAGTVYFEADFHAPWGMAIPAKSVAMFHFIADGQAWLRSKQAPPIELKAGDVVLLAQGDAHEIVHRLDGNTRPASDVLRELDGFSREDADRSPGRRTRLVCGHFDYDRTVRHPLLDSLPRVLHIPVPDPQRARWMSTVTELAAAESARDEESSAVVVDRLAEALLVQTLAVYLSGTESPTGFLAAVRDPQIGRALACLHRRLDESWSVATLAAEVGLSRSAFADRFRQLSGQSPIRYLTEARLLEARRLLRQPSAAATSTADVAHRVGYASEFGFARAFKRMFGRGPGAERRSAAS